MKLLTATGVVLFLSGLLAVLWTYSLNPSDFKSDIVDPIILLMVFGTIALGFVSLGLTRMPVQRSRVRVVAVAFVIIALSVPATFLYAQETSAVGCLCVGTSPGYYVSPALYVPLGTGNGTLTVDVQNDKANDISITAVTFTTLMVGSSSGADNGTTIDAISGLVVMNDGKPVSSANPIRPGDAAVGSISVANVTGGVNYQLSAVITFGNGGQEHETLSLTAQI
jgi:multidrug transporter EmrE-like cation transporter